MGKLERPGLVAMLAWCTSKKVKEESQSSAINKLDSSESRDILSLQCDETFRWWHPLGNSAVESRRELGLQTHTWQLIYGSGSWLPTYSHPPSRKTFPRFQQNSGVKCTYFCLPCIIFFFQLTEVFKLLELKIHNLISHPIPPFSGRSLFPDTQSCPASYIPAQLLSDLSLAEVFGLIQLYIPETLLWFLLLSGENLLSWIISLYFAFLLPNSISLIQNHVVTYSSV